MTRAIIKAPRGGGKSKLLGTLGFDLWYFKGRKVVNMGGSMTQSKIVYGYFRDYCDNNDAVVDYIKGKGNMTATMSVDGNAFNCVAASQKQVRGKHPDVLLSDETCETEDELIHSALPMVDTSDHPLVVMASTFHKIFGIFQETWDNAEELGYERISWDIFDICKVFDASFWDLPEVKRITGIEKLKELSKGRTGDPDGWVNIKNVVQAWREKPTEDWFLVEYMGTRPSAAGLILNPQDVDNAVFDDKVEMRYNFVKGAESIIGLDWGFSSMTAVTDLMRYTDEVVVLQGCKTYSREKLEVIIADVVALVKQKGHRYVYADSAGKFENEQLQSELTKAGLACKVIEVVFSKEKEFMVGNLRAHFENGKFKIPARLKQAIWQYKRYRYQEGSDKPVKKDDHIPDSTMCGLQFFPLNTVSSMPSDSSDDVDSRPMSYAITSQKRF